MRKITVTLAAVQKNEFKVADIVVSVKRDEIDLFLKLVGKDGDEIIDCLEEDKKFCKVYETFLEKFGSKIGKLVTDGFGKYRCLTPSILGSLKVKVPTSIMMRLSDFELMDELFGALYCPSRWRERFQSDFKTALTARLAKINIFAIPDFGMYVGTPDPKAVYKTLSEMYGEKKLRAYWEKLSPVALDDMDAYADDVLEFFNKKFGTSHQHIIKPKTKKK